MRVEKGEVVEIGRKVEVVEEGSESEKSVGEVCERK